MRWHDALSARSLVRSLVLGAGCFVLFVGAGCGRESFNLLAGGGAPSAGAPGAGTANPGAPGGGSSVGGAPAGASGMGGFLDRDAGPRGGYGQGPGGGGYYGMAGYGMGGANGFPGNGGEPPCLPGEACTDGGLNKCPPSVQYCKRCMGPADCDHAEFCDVEAGRCVECRNRDGDCPQGARCNPLTLLCAKACQINGDCHSQTDTVCDPSLGGICVACTKNADCPQVNGGQGQPSCIEGSCVECEGDLVCSTGQVCQAFHCVIKH